MVITSYFTLLGTPATGLSPLISVWEVVSGSSTQIINADPMVEVGAGFYRYNFTSYNYTKNYVISADGGVAMPSDERYSIGSTTESTLDTGTVGEIADRVWNETATDHIQSGSFGLTVQQINADTSQLRLDTLSLETLINIMLKYERNRTKVDKIAKTLTVYDNDGTTPIRVFDLYDSNGVSSVAEIADKVPQ